MTWLYITLAALGGAVLALPGMLWAYRAGHADGRLAEWTRHAARTLRLAQRARQRDRDAWVVFDANLPPAAQRQLARITPPDAGPYLIRQTAPNDFGGLDLTGKNGWDMPVHTAWTGPMTALPEMTR